MKESFVRCTTSVSPLDRDKDTVLDPRQMHLHFSVFYLFQQEIISFNFLSFRALHDQRLAAGPRQGHSP